MPDFFKPAVTFKWVLLLMVFSTPARGQECGVPEVWGQFNFLKGTWKVENSNLMEKWEISGEDVYVAKAYSITGKDTILNETIQLIFDRENIWYKVQVSGQNKGKTVPFRLTQCQGNVFVFENPDHDFPQKIGYRRIGNDKLLAWIEGQQNGKYHKSEWAMRRLNP
jgi:hypothetical protein